MGSLKRVNKVAKDIMDKKFTEFLLAGNWPEIQYHKGVDTESFELIAYSAKHAQFSKAVHNRLVTAGYEYGVFQNKRDDKYRSTVQRIADALTISDVDASDKFKTMFD
jgi:hypothetical protein